MRGAEPQRGEPVEALERVLRATWRQLAQFHGLLALNTARLSAEELHRRHVTDARPARAANQERPETGGFPERSPSRLAPRGDPLHRARRQPRDPSRPAPGSRSRGRDAEHGDRCNLAAIGVAISAGRLRRRETAAGLVRYAPPAGRPRARTPSGAPRSSTARGRGDRARVRCQSRTEIRAGDGHAVTPADVLRFDQQPKRSIGAGRDSGDTTPARPWAFDAVDEGEDPISDPRVGTRVARNRPSLEPGSANKTLTARRRFGGERDGRRCAFPPREMELDRTVGLDPPRLKRVEPPVWPATCHLRKGKPGNHDCSAHVLGRDAASRQIQTRSGYEQGASCPAGAPAHLGVAPRVNTKGGPHDVVRDRDGRLCRLGIPD